MDAIIIAAIMPSLRRGNPKTERSGSRSGQLIGGLRTPCRDDASMPPIMGAADRTAASPGHGHGHGSMDLGYSSVFSAPATTYVPGSGSFVYYCCA
ncbi:hypothetical protein GUJ93_ZPchr0002g23706 [Zizania palustris]|uniref:Uncharacterized protein n=1 Tax=Zizania palustris TaxID=103762 RepID=A0A8J5S9P6_ZIZPA|nr:hypothetical protein GUJ93_ZPchr0002g23706 [Zizania palustris]